MEQVNKKARLNGGRYDGIEDDAADVMADTLDTCAVRLAEVSLYDGPLPADLKKELSQLATDAKHWARLYNLLREGKL